MRRLDAVSALIAASIAPADAIDGGDRTITSLEERRLLAPKIASMTVRHVGAAVSTLTTITLERLALVPPLADTRDPRLLRDALAAIDRARPERSKAASEPRWHLTFTGADGSTLLVVSTTIFAPRHGTIDDTAVLFRDEALVRWLTERYAPEELPLLRA